MFPWATPVQPPAATKPMSHNTQPYPFYAAQNVLQNMPQINQQNVVLNAASAMSKSLQPNAIDPAMVQKWQEWKQWELWQQQFQQWQQQTGQVSAVTTQPCPPPMPSGQPLQPNTIPFQNQQFPYSQPGASFPSINPPLPNQQSNTHNEVGIKRGLEPDFQNKEKKLKIETVNSKKEFGLNEETEPLFEEQFKSWEEKFLTWKEQNKDHPDKTQYLEYEKKWINWRDHLKQKHEALKKKRELKLAEKMKESIQTEENKLQAHQTTIVPNVNTLTNEPSDQVITPNNVSSTSENQIPGLDLAGGYENLSKGFLNVSKILPQNQNGPIQTPDDKPFNFPKSISYPITSNPHLNMSSFGTMNQTPTLMYQNTPKHNWTNNTSKYNNPVLYNNQPAPNVDATSMSKFSKPNVVDYRPSYGENESNAMNSNLPKTSNMNYRRPLDETYNKQPNESSTFYNRPPEDQLYNRNLNTSSNFDNYNHPNKNTSNYNNSTDMSNFSFKYPSSLNTTPSKPPSLMSLNVTKPFLQEKPNDNSESKNVLPNRYQKNWNINDEDDDPENEYMEAHKKFSSEQFDEQNFDNRFSSNKPNRNIYNENSYSRGRGGRKNFNNDYSRPINHSRGSQMMKNTNNEFFRPNSLYSKDESQNYPRESQTLHEDGYYNPQSNVKRDQGFPQGDVPISKGVDDEYSEPPVDTNNFIPQKKTYEPSFRGNYGHPLRGKYGSPSRGKYGSHTRENFEPPKANFGSNSSQTSVEWDNKDFPDSESPLAPIKDTSIPPAIVKSQYQAPPIVPVKIFDYRHLPTLKVIPGLTKETIIPIRIYDHKHGGKRILPWQDRGYSRRNSNQTRDLNDKNVFGSQKNIVISPSKIEAAIENPATTSFIDISSDDKDSSHDNNIASNNEENTTSTIIDTITIVDDDKEEKQPPPIIETIDISAPSPPMVSYNKEVEKLPPRQLLPIETLLCPPGRLNRPSKIVIILRGLPGSGKSYVARLIKEKEVSMGGQAPRILSLDDYFMTEVTKTEIDPETNKKVEIKEMEYEHDNANESLYRTSFIKAFKKKILENYFSFYILDAINNKVTYYKDMLDISKVNGFTPYIIELESDVDLCIKRNIHKRTANDIHNIMKTWVKTPCDQILLDVRSLFNSPSQSEVEMEDVSDIEMELDKADIEMELDKDEEAVETNQSEEDKNIEMEEEDVMKLLSCKWTDTIPQEEKMKRLDGLCKKKTENSIKEWLQIPEDYSISEEIVVKDGKKRVRWADMEERREQEKMRAIGFVVGQTDWDRMLGRDQGESKLTQTKYI